MKPPTHNLLVLLAVVLLSACCQQSLASTPTLTTTFDPTTSPSPSPSPETQNDDCRYNHVHDKCSYVKSDPDCHGTLVEYLEIYACHPSERPWLLVLYIFWLFLVFFLLGTTADKYFCPCLEMMSDTLGLGHRMAGVTLLSLGNGAPDVFSAIAAVRDGQLGLVLGDLSGGGMFDGSIVAGGVLWIAQGLDSKSWHLKDVILYLGSVCVLCLLLKLNAVTHATAGIMLGYYVVYVVVVFFTDRQSPEDESEAELEPSNWLEQPFAPSDQTPVQQTAKSASGKFLAAIKFVLKAVEFPFDVLRNLSIVVPTPDRWNRVIASIATAMSPVLVGFWQNVLTKPVYKQFPLYGLLLIVGALLGLCVFFTSTPKQPPRFVILLLLLGFVNSAVWIDIFASELVEVLSALGLIMNISQLFLGVTVLAWGNCVGDLTANWLMTRNKRHTTAITACYAGPLFNILIGLGFGVALRQRPIHVSLDTNSLISFAFLVGTLVVTVVVATILSPRVSKKFAFVLWALYGAYLTTILVMEFA